MILPLPKVVSTKTQKPLDLTTCNRNKQGVWFRGQLMSRDAELDPLSAFFKIRASSGNQLGRHRVLLQLELGGEQGVLLLLDNRRQCGVLLLLLDIRGCQHVLLLLLPVLKEWAAVVGDVGGKETTVFEPLNVATEGLVAFLP